MCVCACVCVRVCVYVCVCVCVCVLAEAQFPEQKFVVFDFYIYKICR